MLWVRAQGVTLILALTLSKHEEIDVFHAFFVNNVFLNAFFFDPKTFNLPKTSHTDVFCMELNYSSDFTS